MSRDLRVDAYIENAGDFAKPILRHFREVVHSVDPGINEGIKWHVPAFLWKGRQIANMAAFREYASFNFWGRQEKGGAAAPKNADARMRLTKIADLPPDADLIARVRREMEMVDQGGAVPKAAPAPKLPLAMPADFAAALDADEVARTYYEGFPPSAQREYLQWISDAKQKVTRESRILQAVEWIAEGKRRNWKYQR